jgi:hypothetical protein
VSWASRKATPYLRRNAVWLAVTLGAAAWAAAIVRLPGPAVIDPDGQASVLYLDRMIHGQRLEEPLLSTPKPLLTLTHGLAWMLTHDWRTITLLTIIVFGVAATSLARAAARLAGPPAAVATLVVMAGSGALMLQVARGNSLVWAFAAWAVALAALTVPERPRWPVAGVALLLAGLARTETWLLLPLVAVYVVLAWRRGTRSSCWLLLAFAAPVLWFAHDSLLTGDPMWSSKVPIRYTDLISGRHIIPPATWAADVARRYAAQPALLAVALAGVAGLAAHRAWLVLVSASALALAVLTLLGWYASQGVYISWRYYDPSDLALRLLAAFGAATLAISAIDWLTLRRSTVAGSPTSRPANDVIDEPAGAAAAVLADPAPTAAHEAGAAESASGAGTSSGARTALRIATIPGGPTSSHDAKAHPRDRDPSRKRSARMTLAASALAAIAAIAVTWPLAPVDPIVDSTLDRDTRLAANATAAVEALRPIAATGQPIAASGPQRVRVALALDLPLAQVRDLFMGTLHTPVERVLADTRAVYHDADGDRPIDRFAPLTRTTPGRLGALELHPILTDPATGLYVLRVDTANPSDPSPAPPN